MSKVRVRHGLIMAGLSAWLLWSHSYPEPRWLVMGHFEAQENCQEALGWTGAEVVSPDVPWRVRCLPVGVDPDRLHPLYNWFMAIPMGAPDR